MYAFLSQACHMSRLDYNRPSNRLYRITYKAYHFAVLFTACYFLLLGPKPESRADPSGRAVCGRSLDPLCLLYSLPGGSWVCTSASGQGATGRWNKVKFVFVDCV
jgi:hypothetical protein